ncbi:uncharacterized protein LOC134240968 [Saccostrea cucullata]|uniref:uncharacterized protein LOC134240968 n=1 Tax=Saccostrea cuccullata TaxID=36930 RepID=UPI002ED51CCD
MGCRKDTQIGKDGTENEDSEKGTCDKRNINEGKTYEKDVSPESEKETTFHQTDEKSSVEVDLENKSSIKSLTQKDDFIEGGTSSNKELDTFSNNANQTADKTTDLQLRDAKEPMGSDSTEEKRAPIGEDIKTTAELPQNGNKMETPPTERKVPIAGGSVDEGTTSEDLTFYTNFPVCNLGF